MCTKPPGFDCLLPFQDMEWRRLTEAYRRCGMACCWWSWSCLQSEWSGYLAGPWRRCRTDTTARQGRRQKVRQCNPVAEASGLVQKGYFSPDLLRMASISPFSTAFDSISFQFPKILGPGRGWDLHHGTLARQWLLMLLCRDRWVLPSNYSTNYLTKCSKRPWDGAECRSL